jgi:hypothetical protein
MAVVSARARSIAGCGRQEIKGLGQLIVGVRGLTQEGLEPRVGRVGGLEGIDDRQGALALADVGARRLAEDLRGRGDVDEVVGQLEGDADALAVLRHHRDDLTRAPGEQSRHTGRPSR